MRRVFADAYYWVALLNDKDQGHRAARDAGPSLEGVTIVTTDEVLIEVLAYFSERGTRLRQVAATFAEGILTNPDILVHAQTRGSFLNGLTLYKARPDKGYSLTDCISMVRMRQEGLDEVLTRDDHFRQEGFRRLL